MLRNYLKSIIRSLFRNKIYTFFSIISLTLGFLCSIFAYLYISNELSYDDFFENSDRIYRLETITSFGTGKTMDYAILPGSSLPVQWSSVPHIKQKTRLVALASLFLQPERQQRFNEKYGFAADSVFFDVFSFQILKGYSKDPLAGPNSIVLTKELAQKYFGDTNPIGKTITIYFRKKELSLNVSAVMENVPSNSHFRFSFLISESALENLYGVSFSDVYAAYQYLLLSPGADKNIVETALNRLWNKAHQKDNIKQDAYRLRPLTDIHLHSSARAEIKPNSSIRYVYILAIIAGIILIISCINYISLFLSESVYRYKQLSIRKILGASSGQQLTQLFLESVVISLVSFVIAVLLCSPLLPVFNVLVGKSFVFQDLMLNGIIWKGFIFSGLIGIISAVYPALIIFTKNRVNVSSAHFANGKQKSWLQNAIVITQFAASAVLIIGTLIVYSQLNYIQEKDLGFNEEGIITVPNYLGEKAELFKVVLSDNKNIKSISISSYIPGVSNTGGTAWVKSLSNGKEITANWISTDYNYFETYGLNVIKGRSFSKEHSTDSLSAYLLNEAAVKALGLKHPVGKQLIFGVEKGTVIGVIQNFNYLSLRKQIPPMLFLINDDLYFSISIKLADKANIAAALAQIENAWHQVRPNVPFRYSFLQDKISKLYKSERNLGQVVLAFSIIAIFVACLGLFSLAAFSMQKRTKEIGIRKVLGATVENILQLFYSKYFKLILIANVIAFPVAYFLARYWLANFAYKVEIGFLPFLISIVITCFFTAAALSYWGMKAAWLNPVDSIRTE